MPDLHIAGHQFHFGRCIKGRVDGSNCQRELLDVLPFADFAYVGARDIAHEAHLTAGEVIEMQTYATKLRQNIINATHLIEEPPCK